MSNEARRITRNNDDLTYFADMLLNPLQGLALVFQTIVQTGSFFNLFSGKESVRSNPIVESDHHHIVSGCLDQPSAVIVGI
jgi:hypothetical protein